MNNLKCIYEFIIESCTYLHGAWAENLGGIVRGLSGLRTLEISQIITNKYDSRNSMHRLILLLDFYILALIIYVLYT